MTDVGEQLLTCDLRKLLQLREIKLTEEQNIESFKCTRNHPQHYEKKSHSHSIFSLYPQEEHFVATN